MLSNSTSHFKDLLHPSFASSIHRSRNMCFWASLDRYTAKGSSHGVKGQYPHYLIDGLYNSHLTEFSSFSYCARLRTSQPPLLSKSLLGYFSSGSASKTSTRGSYMVSSYLSVALVPLYSCFFSFSVALRLLSGSKLFPSLFTTIATYKEQSYLSISIRQ